MISNNSKEEYHPTSRRVIKSRMVNHHRKDPDRSRNIRRKILLICMFTLFVFAVLFIVAADQRDRIGEGIVTGPAILFLCQVLVKSNDLSLLKLPVLLHEYRVWLPVLRVSSFR